MGLWSLYWRWHWTMILFVSENSFRLISLKNKLLALSFVCHTVILPINCPEWFHKTGPPTETGKSWNICHGKHRMTKHGLFCVKSGSFSMKKTKNTCNWLSKRRGNLSSKFFEGKKMKMKNDSNYTWAAISLVHFLFMNKLPRSGSFFTSFEYFIQ